MKCVDMINHNHNHIYLSIHSATKNKGAIILTGGGPCVCGGGGDNNGRSDFHHSFRG